ncbi:MAG: 4Fe-4S dicluster domain-containing protein [Caldilineaceae bacterium]|nr:4Fe-4S dicluster domain-containing protein [Caldilineaceae bacterium]MCB9138339.1 4Fe-4S dicluster domain-containing protein [Caldilineaceae bacterium]
MRHDIPVDAFGPQGTAMAEAVDKCVHCGFCLATCPTYQVMGEEPDSPRGRIILMKEALEGRLTTAEVEPYVDRCLGCMACVTTCPSGVEYGNLLTPFRALQEKDRARSPMERFTRTLVSQTLPYPRRFRTAARLGKLAAPAAGLLPGSMRAMLDLLPDELPAQQPLPEIYPAQGERRARVALLAGCAQQVLAPQINWATLRVLARNGVETIIPRGQGCCGALALHTGEAEQARRLAQNNMAVFPQDVDAVITNAAGCGSGMHEYPLLFKGTMREEPARAFASRVMDVSVFLAQLGLVEPPPLSAPLTIAYHDACHLAHAQGVTAEPRALLRAIPNVTLVEIPERELCCGSAGTYNLEQPDLARQIGERKARHILTTDADVVVTGNIGCMTQLRTRLDALDSPLPVWHTLEALDRAYGGNAA